MLLLIFSSLLFLLFIPTLVFTSRIPSLQHYCCLGRSGDVFPEWPQGTLIQSYGTLPSQEDIGYATA